MGLSKEQQRELIRAKNKVLGEFVSVVKAKPKRKKKPKRKPVSKKARLRNKKEKKTKLTRYHKYLLSDEWAQLRLDLFKHRGYACEECGHKYKLQVHHLTYNNIYNEEPEDLIILCEKHHIKEHKRLKSKANI